MPDGQVIPLPPVILGSLGNDPKKETLCVYGHLDVQPAKKSDGWDTEPFVLTEVNISFYLNNNQWTDCNKNSYKTPDCLLPLIVIHVTYN